MRFANEIADAFHLWAFLFAGLCGVVRGFVGDAVAQVVEGRKPAALDLRRSAVYTTFTCFYGGFVEYFFFTLLYPTWFSASNWRTVSAQLCMDNFVVTPFGYYTCFYLIKGTIERRGRLDAAADLRRWSAELWAQMLVAWRFWVPIDLVVVTVIPDDWRVPFMSLIAVCWVGVLSIVTSKIDRGVVTTKLSTGELCGGDGECEEGLRLLRDPP